MRNASDTIRTIKTQEDPWKTHRCIAPCARQAAKCAISTSFTLLLKPATPYASGPLDEEGMFIVPMSFGYDWADPESPGNNAPTPRLALWVHSAPEGRKAELFNREPRVAIEMDIEDGVIEGPYACAYSYAYRSIRVRVPFIESKAPKQNVTGSLESCIIWPRS